MEDLLTRSCPVRLQRIIDLLSSEKMNVVIDIGFRGILHLHNIQIDKRLFNSLTLNMDSEGCVNNCFVDVTNEDAYQPIGLTR